MRANVIYHENGVGLSADAGIVSERLARLGFDVTRSECFELRAPAKRSDLNVHLELFDPFWLDHARTTLLVPNQEWLPVDLLDAVAPVDAVLCKTRFAERVLRSYGLQTQYIGFTSRDRYRPSVPRDPGKWLHLVGCSGQKGTPTVVETWKQNPDFPPLTIVYHPRKVEYTEIITRAAAPNIRPLATFLRDDELDEIMNSHQVHVCPSETEGFGHSLNEARACKAVVIAIDAPPMNELVNSESGVPVAWDDTIEDPDYPGLTRRYRVSAARLAEAVRRVLALSGSARDALGERARARFLEEGRRFGQAFDHAIADVSLTIDN